MCGKNKKIIIITERYAPEPFLITDLAEEWVKQGNEVTVVTQIPSYPGDKIYKGYKNSKLVETINGVKIVRFPTVTGYSKSLYRKILNYLLFMLRELWFAFIASKDADAVFVYHTGPLTQALAVIPIKIFRKIPITIWTQDVWPDAVFAYGFPEQGAFAVILKNFVKFIYYFCDTILVTSPGFIERLKPYTKNKIVEFIPQWVPDEIMKCDPSPFNLTEGASKFIFTGNLGSMQALDVVIKAFAELKQEDIVLYILGDGNKRKDFELLAKSLDATNIKFLGSLPQRQVLHCIRQCDFSVLSLSPNKLISLTIPAKFQTYLAAGKPILAITAGEVSRLIQENNIGIACYPDKDLIIKSIKELIATNKSASFTRNLLRLQPQFDRNKIINTISYYLI
ncbi:glycosyltransferase family 4 protein [Gracilinema caldarium]|uniref:Glycosyl transferase group 1 n=1 Tax=Gracilinema caldarium (strain ATCC 51460 / DSM 7334 / H1) TaxID=744872 RepID=F8F036_GRAC1|nr:glycosyltransferase family 4 protein [Gracilinema caldarium]AEJ18689.1 glycosyl transferase group 1 [Gracilinema caldarium DSM 7334]